MDDSKELLINLSDTIEPSLRSGTKEYDDDQNHCTNKAFFGVSILIIIDGIYRVLMLVPLTFNDKLQPAYALIVTLATIPLILAVIYAITYISGVRYLNLIIGSLTCAAIGNILIASWTVYFMFQLEERQTLSLR